MSTTQVTLLAFPRSGATFGDAASLPSGSGANAAKKAIGGAASMRVWYRHPERLMSQSERLPS